jgi:hypothetical protein
MTRFFSAFLAVLAASKVYASVDIVPGATWTAVGHVQAHGHGLM